MFNAYLNFEKSSISNLIVPSKRLSLIISTSLVTKSPKAESLIEFELNLYSLFSNKATLNLLISYYVKTPEQSTFMQINQKINLEIKEAFEKEGIQFAFPPAQTVLLP